MTKEQLIAKAETFGEWVIEKMKVLPMESAGILFCHRGEEGVKYLLVKNGHGSWGIPFAWKRVGDEDAYAAAVRVNQEIMGDWRSGRADPEGWTLPLVLAEWHVYIEELAELAEEEDFPPVASEGFRARYDQAMWVGVGELPKRTQWLLRVVLWLSQKRRRKQERESEEEGG